MALLPILHYPDPRLHTIAKPVTTFDEALRDLVEDMFETMYHAPGIGLAATQVNHHIRMMVIDVTEDKSQQLVFVNPEIIHRSNTTKDYEEGCLSVPDYVDNVTRPDTIKVRAQDEYGASFEMDADGVLSVCIQHEIDHLNGKVFLQHLLRLKQGRLRERFLKLQRDAKVQAGA